MKPDDLSGPKFILHAPVQDEAELERFVERCLSLGASLIAVVGPGCDHVEDLIDELVIGDGSDEGRFVNTTSHLDESLEDVRHFAHWWGVVEGKVTEVLV